MKRLLLMAVTASALAMMYGHADALITITFVDDDSGPVQTFISPLPTGVSSFIFPGNDTAQVILVGVTLGPDVPVSQVIGLSEAADPMGPASDLIQIVRSSSGDTVIVFQSDSDAPGAVPLPRCDALPTCVPETQEVFVPDLPLVTATGGSETLRVSAASDVVVPEPAVLLMIGSGLVGLGALRYRRSGGR